MHRVLVCGGRDFVDASRVVAVLGYYRSEAGGFEVLIHGAARGADSLAGEWAKMVGVEVLAFPANWNTFGKAAGSIRNGYMLREGKPTLVIAFPGGAGTRDMIGKAKRAGVPVLKIPA